MVTLNLSHLGDCSHACPSIISLSYRFNGHFSRWIWVSRYQNVSILDFVGAKDDGDGGGKAAVKSSPLANQRPTFYRPDALPVAHPTASKR